MGSDATLQTSLGHLTSATIAAFEVDDAEIAANTATLALLLFDEQGKAASDPVPDVQCTYWNGASAADDDIIRPN